MLKYQLIVLALTLLSSINSQSIPELNIEDDKSFYLGIYNEIPLKLNGCDISKVKLKAKDAQLRKINDSLHTVYLRGINEDQQIKIKLYYKSLPVDIKTVSILTSPELKVSYAGNSKSARVPIRDLAKTKIDVRFKDSQLQNDGYEIFSYNIQYRNAQNKIIPLAASRTNGLNVLGKFINRLKPGDAILFNDFRMKSRFNNVINCQSNYFEIIITE